MKRKLLCSFRPAARLFLAAFIITLAFGQVAHSADDVATLFQQGRNAYYQGNFELARKLLTQVAALKPDHFETKAMLAQINMRLKNNGGSLQKQYAAVNLPKVEFADVSLTEAVTALGLLARKATDGKVQPNFIVKNPEMAKKTISLNLNNVPLTEAINYLAELSGAKAVYDKHAVIFQGLTE